MQRILLVEDIDDVRNTLARVLEMWGHEVEKAATGLTSVDVFASFNPQVALIDIGLPDIDGYEVARRLRALPDGSAVRLIAITGYDELADKEAAFAAGFDQHFTKPLDLSRLEETLAAH